MNCLRRKLEIEEHFELCAKLRDQIEAIGRYLAGYGTLEDLNRILDEVRDVQEMIAEIELEKLTSGYE